MVNRLPRTDHSRSRRSRSINVRPIALTTGAIFGDGLSYWLGHHYHREITTHWPLSRYPALIDEGEALFKRHGGKSVFIARFTPGVRAIVPLMAGILGMPVTRFYVMNILSAIAWGPSHVLAGALVGATLALLGAIAWRLALLAVVLVAGGWAIGWVTRWLVNALPAFAAHLRERLTAWASARGGASGRMVLSLLDPQRPEIDGLTVLGILLVGALWLFIGILEDIISGDPLVRADQAVFALLQSLRTTWGDQIVVGITEIGDGAVTFAVAAAGLLWLAWQRAWRAALYGIAAVAGASLFTVLLKITLHHPRPGHIYAGWDAFSFPSGHTTVNTVLYGFLALLIGREVNPRWRTAATARPLAAPGIRVHPARNPSPDRRP